MVNKAGVVEEEGKTLPLAALQSPLILILHILSFSPLSKEHSCVPRVRGQSSRATVYLPGSACAQIYPLLQKQAAGSFPSLAAQLTLVLSST